MIFGGQPILVQIHRQPTRANGKHKTALKEGQ